MIVEKDKYSPNIYWLREAADQLAFAYVERVANGCWWLSLPACAGYFSTKKAALKAAS